MIGRYVLGVATLPAAAIVLAGAWWVAAAARTLWARTHNALVQKVTLRKNLAEFPRHGTEPEPERPEYEDAANGIRDALLRSPRLWRLRGLGWIVLLVREHERRDT